MLMRCVGTDLSNLFSGFRHGSQCKVSLARVIYEWTALSGGQSAPQSIPDAALRHPDFAHPSAAEFVIPAFGETVFSKKQQSPIPLQSGMRNQSTPKTPL